MRLVELLRESLNEVTRSGGGALALVRAMGVFVCHAGMTAASGRGGNGGVIVVGCTWA